jgi:GNAT superfamily N-acetyltransferase
MRIRPAVADDLGVLQEIEVAAGRAFRDVGMAEVARDEPATVAELTRYQRAGNAWVTVEPADRPVAYLIAEPVDGNLHIEQVSVHPDAARRGVGRALIEHVADRTRGDGVPALTLTTFTEVPWNAPYYRRCGFRPLADAEVTPGLLAIRRHEADLGLDRWPRICMRRNL